MNALPLKVGILGGGQLARMMALAAHGLGIRPFIFADNAADCATAVCADVSLNDGSVESLRRFCAKVDLVTIENEFIDLQKLEDALHGRPVYPSVDCLRKIQNKLHQKLSLADAGIPCLDFTEVTSKVELAAAASRFKSGVVLKQAAHAYDGRGTHLFAKGELSPETFWSERPGFVGYAEPLVPFKKELAVVVARSVRGEVRAFPLVETRQESGICNWAVAPARTNPKVTQRALAIGREVIERFDGVGVFGIEMFLLKDDPVVVNEIAPRVHNSGHWTMNGCVVSQFEQHLRAIAGMPLVNPVLSFPAVAMVNVLGRKDGELKRDNSVSMRAPLGLLEKNSWLHWYGKSGKTLRRKLGHVNAGGRNFSEALRNAEKVRAKVDV